MLAFFIENMCCSTLSLTCDVHFPTLLVVLFSICWCFMFVFGFPVVCVFVCDQFAFGCWCVSVLCLFVALLYRVVFDAPTCLMCWICVWCCRCLRFVCHACDYCVLLCAACIFVCASVLYQLLFMLFACLISLFVYVLYAPFTRSKTYQTPVELRRAIHPTNIDRQPI